MLGLSTLKAARKISCHQDGRLAVLNQTVALPRGDRSERILEMEAEQKRLLQSLRGTSLSFKTFLSLTVKHGLSSEFPSYYSHGYLHDRALGRSDLSRLDAANCGNMKAYMRNILVMEELTRLQTNLALLRKHQKSLVASGKPTIDAEVLGMRIGDFVLVSFTGELSVQIGLNIKKASPHKSTFVAPYSNGYIYYAPTAEQLKNLGGAQEDSDCLLAPQWQKLFEAKALEILSKL